jgi:hypothetical protein
MTITPGYPQPVGETEIGTVMFAFANIAAFVLSRKLGKSE